MNVTLRTFPALMILVLGLVGCSTRTLVTLQDGTQYVTEARPQLEREQGFYEFKDVAGKQIRVKVEDIATIKAED